MEHSALLIESYIDVKNVSDTFEEPIRDEFPIVLAFGGLFTFVFGHKKYS